MKKKFSLIIIFTLGCFIFLGFGKQLVVFAQQAAKTSFVTQVGEPEGPPPNVSNITPGGITTCPIPNGKIGCGSYGKPESWGGFHGSCAVDSTGNGGHCSQIYVRDVGICTTLRQGGNLIRTAKSIDVNTSGSKAGDPVLLPSLNGEVIKWKYLGVYDAGFGFGWMKIFQSVGARDGVWTLHLVHVNSAGPMGIGETKESGQPAATLYNLKGYIHAHITIGLNIQEPVTDAATSFRAYDPNWKFPDRDLGMCTK
jgi:hypothetical protein